MSLCFVIPLRTARTPQECDGLSSRINATLHSIKNQTAASWSIVIVADNRIGVAESLQNVVVAPRTLSVQGKLDKREDRWEEDASTRRLEGVRCALQSDASHVMCLDADDLVHNRLVEHVLESSGDQSHRISDGYQLLVRFNRVVEIRHVFPAKCGSSLILSRRAVEDYFALDSDAISDRYQFHHHQASNRIESAGVRDMPFPAGVYCTEHGENLTYSSSRWRELIKTSSGLKYLAGTFYKKLKYSRWNESLTERFGDPFSPPEIIRIDLPK